jgi:hypothetical protein
MTEKHWKFVFEELSSFMQNLAPMIYYKYNCEQILKFWWKSGQCDRSYWGWKISTLSSASQRRPQRQNQLGLLIWCLLDEHEDEAHANIPIFALMEEFVPRRHPIPRRHRIQGPALRPAPPQTLRGLCAPAVAHTCSQSPAAST